MKTFTLSKTVKKTKRQATDREQILENHIFTKGLISRLSKELSKLSSKKQSHQNMGKRPEETFHQKIYMDGK